MPTAKRLKHLERQNKKQYNQRTRDERFEDTKTVREKISKSQIPSSLPEIQKFFHILDEYVENGVSSSGIIPIDGIDYEIVYQFPLNKNLEVGAMMKSTSQ
jgi:hypothetical protein